MEPLSSHRLDAKCDTMRCRISLYLNENTLKRWPQSRSANSTLSLSSNVNSLHTIALLGFELNFFFPLPSPKLQMVSLPLFLSFFLSLAGHHLLAGQTRISLLFVCISSDVYAMCFAQNEPNRTENEII